jgi:SAM-dependent methyltransferase
MGNKGKGSMAHNCPCWYERWFGEDYLRVYAHRDDKDARIQAELITGHFPPKEFPELLDLCCGDGRHVRIFTEKGYSVTGIDLSPLMIETARNRACGNVSLAVKDMREIEWKETFDIVVNLFTSFGYFEDEEEDLQVVRAVHASLKKGGVFWLDFMNRDFVIENLKDISHLEVEDFTVEEHRRLTGDEKRIEKDIVITKEDDSRTYNESVRLYSQEEIHSLLSRGEFEIINKFGDYNGTEFSKTSERLIIVSRK